MEEDAMSGLGRTVGTIFLVLGVLLIPVSVTGWWVQATLTNTDRYVETVAPLATDPEVVAAVEDRIVEQVMIQLDKQRVVDAAAEALVRQGLPERVTALLPLLSATLRDRAEEAVSRVVHKLVTSPAFADAWEAANRSAHEQLLSVLEGDQSGVLTTSGNTISIQLATLTGTIRGALVDAGLGFADKLPTLDASFPLARVDDLEKAQTGYTILDKGGSLMPWVTLALLVGGVALVKNRRRAVVLVAAGGVVALILLALGLSVAKTALLDGLPGAPPHPGAEAALPIVFESLRHLVRWTGVLLLVAAVVAVVTGPSSGAVALRQGVVRGWTVSSEAARGWRWTTPVAGGIAALAVLVLLVGKDRGVWYSLLLVVLALGGGAVAAIVGREHTDEAT
jgi:hypothetical protein